MSDSPRPPKPAWETDFPVDRVEATHVSRREFVKYLCVVSGGLAAGTGFLAVKDKLIPRREFHGELKVCDFAELPVGGTRGFTLPDDSTPYILIRMEDDTLRAYEQKCTHLSCAVYYKPGTGKIECPCHNGWFDARTGAVLQGPPPRGLPALTVLLRDGQVFVTGNARSA